MNCYRHDNDHWRTAPFWTAGPFCFCMSTSNNTYNCVRTINATHNLLYCEFITGLITYYNLRIGMSGCTFLTIKPAFMNFNASSVKHEYNITLKIIFHLLTLNVFSIDIISDPFETQNRYKYLTPQEKEYFHNQLQQLLGCRGPSCRRFSHSNPHGWYC